MLEKILEEILEQLKEEGCIIDNDAGNRAEERPQPQTAPDSKSWFFGFRSPPAYKEWGACAPPYSMDQFIFLL